MNYKYREISFSDDDIIESDECIYKDDYNPHNVRPWLAHDHGFVYGIVFASCEQDALDTLADEGRLDAWQVDLKTQWQEFGDTEEEAEERMTYLGNASEPFDIETLSLEELPIIKFSWVAMFKANMEGEV
jgi:hypothetical protein